MIGVVADLCQAFDGDIVLVLMVALNLEVISMVGAKVESVGDVISRGGAGAVVIVSGIECTEFYSCCIFFVSNIRFVTLVLFLGDTFRIFITNSCPFRIVPVGILNIFKYVE